MIFIIYVIDKCAQCCDAETPITDLIMATVNGKNVTVTNILDLNGYSLKNLAHHTPAEVKAAVDSLQKALQGVISLGNGEDNTIVNILSRQCYEMLYTNGIGKLIADVPTTSSEFRNGEFVEDKLDFSDVPFIRELSENWGCGDFKYEEI